MFNTLRWFMHIHTVYIIYYIVCVDVLTSQSLQIWYDLHWGGTRTYHRTLHQFDQGFDAGQNRRHFCRRFDIKETLVILRQKNQGIKSKEMPDINQKELNRKNDRILTTIPSWRAQGVWTEYCGPSCGRGRSHGTWQVRYHPSTFVHQARTEARAAVGELETKNPSGLKQAWSMGQR